MLQWLIGLKNNMLEPGEIVNDSKWFATFQSCFLVLFLLPSTLLHSFGYQSSSHIIFKPGYCYYKVQKRSKQHTTHMHSESSKSFRPAMYGRSKTHDRTFLKMGTFYSFLGTYYGTYDLQWYFLKLLYH